MKEIKFAVTSNKNDNRKMIIQAKSWAEELQVPYAPRYENGSLDKRDRRFIQRKACSSTIRVWARCAGSV